MFVQATLTGRRHRQKWKSFPLCIQQSPVFTQIHDNDWKHCSEHARPVVGDVWWTRPLKSYLVVGTAVSDVVPSYHFHWNSTPCLQRDKNNSLWSPVSKVCGAPQTQFGCQQKGANTMEFCHFWPFPLTALSLTGYIWSKLARCWLHLDAGLNYKCTLMPLQTLFCLTYANLYANTTDQCHAEYNPGKMKCMHARRSKETSACI